MNARSFPIILLSDFNTDPLAGLLSNDPSLPTVNATSAPFGQVYQTLIDPNHECWQQEYDAAVVWTRPEGVIDSFGKALRYEPVDDQAIMAEVDRFAEAIGSLVGRAGTVLVPSWVVPSHVAGYGMLDMHGKFGLRGLLSNMNARLADQLQPTSGVYLLDTQRWLTGAQDPFNPKLWYMAKIAFGHSVLKSAVADIKAAVSAVKQGAKKVVVVDLDDTLWGGIVGDVGWQSLRLGGHDPIGEAFVDFQRALKSLTNRGILLGIVSKNDEQVALEAIDQNSDMILKREDFAAWRINWNDKAQNLVELLAELNLGLDSAVFLDDNPVERARVRDTLPDVLVPEMPTDKMLYVQTLTSLTCFSTPALTQEDLARGEMYRVERARENSKKSVGSIDQWLGTLETKVVAEPMNDSNRTRASQLVAKTNQMNLTTRRLSESELAAWVDAEGHWLWTFRVSDKFGDSGLTGVASLEVDGNHARIVDFILSCRVMGRRIERAIVAVLVDHAKSLGLKEIVAEYLPTERNKPCLEFWEGSGFDRSSQEMTFRWPADREYAAPDSIELIIE